MKLTLKIIISTIIIGYSSVAFGQIPINFGFAGGVSQGKYNIGIDTLKGENVTAWQGGVFARIKIKKLYIGADALLKSNPGEFTSTSGDTKGEISVLGVDIPIMLGWKIVDKKIFNFRIYGGPSMQMNFHEKVKTSFNGSSFEANDSWQFKGGPKWSLVAGTGIDLSFVTLDIRYLYSVSDWSNLSVSEVNNSGVQLNLGFKIL